MSKTTESCQSCKFWKRLKSLSDVAGECRRFPPYLTRKPDVSMANYEFPWTLYVEWCGEYVKGEVKP